MAKILPIETADMCWTKYIDNRDITSLHATVNYGIVIIDYPCWSLSALLGVLPDSIYDNTNEFSQLEFTKKSVAYHDMNDGIKVGSIKDNLVDACYEMILKLHELKML